MDQSSIKCQEAKELDLVTFLEQLGYHPASIHQIDYWYLSPLRTEKNPSFKVNRKINRWYDHGIGRGGTLVDFGMEYYHCSLREFLDRLTRDLPTLSFHSSILKECSDPLLTDSGDAHQRTGIKLLDILGLHSFNLLLYLSNRAIPVGLGSQYCQEIIFEINGKRQRAIGFKNDQGGYELRNEYFKGTSKPKDITYLHGGRGGVAIFEGFIDFLSYLAQKQGKTIIMPNFLVLNSLSQFERSRPLIETHPEVQLFLDRDQAGKAVTSRAMGLGKIYVDHSSLYDGYKDLNEWWVSSAKAGSTTQKK